MNNPKLTMITKIQLERELLQTVVSECLAKAVIADVNGSRWVNAINRAVAQLEENPFITYQPETRAVLVLSESGEIYTSNGVCQCKAFALNQPCWHRAAARLVTRCVEKQAAATKPQTAAAVQDAAVYFQPNEKKAEKIGGIRI